ncbi:MAG: serine hydrolase [Alkalispirochaeta sp.]
MLQRRIFQLGASVLALSGMWAAAPLFGQSVPVPQMTSPAESSTHLAVGPPELEYAQAATLLEVETDTVLFEMRGRESWPPASLTKLVTIYTALQAAEEGRFDLDRAAPVDPSAYASAVPPGSSLMFLGPDQLVNGRDLLRGLAISSGNDAAVEVALRVSGSVEAFHGEMNEVAQRLGYESFHFEDAAGLDAANRVTAVEFARFARDLITRWPWLTDEVFSLEQFTYPEAHHYPTGGGGGSIRQFNRNGLVAAGADVDGLKTGFIEESGYNIAVTAARDGRRLIAVVLGVSGATHQQGGTRRELDARALVEWGFERYENTELELPAADPITVWGGDRRTFVPIARSQGPITIPQDRSADISGTIEQTNHIWAPVSENSSVGMIRYTLEDTVIREVPLVAEDSIPEGSWFRRVIDRIRWWLQGLFGGRASA